MKNLSVAASILTATLTAASAGAMQNIKFGATLDINPVVSVQQSYDSNIYLADKAPKSALINRSGLGVGLVNKIGSRLDLKGGYTAEFLSYSRDSNINNVTHQLANFSATARLPRDMVAALDDDYKLTSDPANSADYKRARRVQNIAGFTLNAPIRGKFGFNLAAQHTYHNYLAGTYNILDRQETLVGGDISYRLQPKTSLVFGYRYGTMAYRLASVNKGDSHYNNLHLGVTGHLASKLTGTVKAGVQFRNYERSLVQSSRKAKNNVATGGCNVQVVWKPEQLTDVTLLGGRGNVETSYGSNDNSRYYTSTMADVMLSRQVNKIKAGLGLNYEDLAFPEKYTTINKKRADTNTGVRLTAEYNIQKWLKAGLGYAYKHRTSNVKSFGYSDSIVSLDLKGMF